MSTARLFGPVLFVSLGIAGCPGPEVVDGDGGTPGIDAAIDARRIDARMIDAPACGSPADCDDGLYCNGAEACTAAACAAGSAPCAAAACDEAANACSCTDPDADDDGESSPACGGDDCDDEDAARHPGATEVCNTVDDDCNGSTDEGTTTTFYADADADGFGDASMSVEACSAPAGHVASANDCDDSNASRNPSATETCNTIDDDCDGTVDDGLTCDPCAGVVCNTPAAPRCVASAVRTETGPGTCAGGTCTYPFTDAPCAMGCASGACITGTCAPGPVTITTANPTPPAASSVHASVFDGRCGAAVGQIFPPDAPWNQSVRTTCVDPGSDAIIDYLEAVVTGSQTFRIDLGNASDLYGFNPLAADDAVTHRMFTPTSEFYAGHCDRARIPVPTMGRLEGEANYTCADGGDCHLTVFDTAECRLFEMWRANDALGTFRGGCLAVWTNALATTSNLRGLSCTSADAGGFPIMPMLITPQEIRAGRIRHALRFILPNNAVRRFVYVRPGTHNPLDSGSPTAGPAGTMAPPYGVRLRLRADFPTTGLSPGARAIVEALQEFGMFHADGGNVTFIASNDVYSTAHWDDADIDLGPSDLRAAGMRWTDFDVVSDLSDTESMAATDCSRTPLSEF